ncbi:hypothetical protein ACFQHO_11250 [Actinomadura yumaensis]|uniref:hypothetical protein n=1 Tax=Actinomadura yumaensis TaxID=111807 RepID=UPI003606922E
MVSSAAVVAARVIARCRPGTTWAGTAVSSAGAEGSGVAGRQPADGGIAVVMATGSRPARVCRISR